MIAADPGARPRIDTIRATVQARVVEARDRAISWPAPDPEDRLKYVYA